MSDDFNERPLVAGSLIGVRAFNVQAGLLVSPARPTIFRPGENVAVCKRTDLEWAIARWDAAIRKAYKLPPVAILPNGHAGGSIDCSCGFYAYTDTGRNIWLMARSVAALIEGYGRATVGSRGFRVEKARLVALIDPLSMFWPALTGEDFSEVRANYPDVPVYASQDEAIAAHPLTPTASTMEAAS